MPGLPDGSACRDGSRCAGELPFGMPPLLTRLRHSATLCAIRPRPNPVQTHKTFPALRLPLESPSGTCIDRNETSRSSHTHAPSPARGIRQFPLLLGKGIYAKVHRNGQAGCIGQCRHAKNYSIKVIPEQGANPRHYFPEFSIQVRQIVVVSRNPVLLVRVRYDICQQYSK